MNENDNLKVAYYYVDTNGLKLAFLLLLSGIILWIIFKNYKRKNPNSWISRQAQTYSQRTAKTLIAFVLTVVICVIIAGISTWFGPYGMACTEEVKGSTLYIPDVDALCTVEGERRFESYDEYRAYYFELKAEREANHYDVRRDYKKVENVVPLYVVTGGIILYFILRKRRNN